MVLINNKIHQKHNKIFRIFLTNEKKYVKIKTLYFKEEDCHGYDL